jgi:Protein of unknown function (DUF418)
LRANGSRECAPDDRLREAIQRKKKDWIASSLALLAMTKTTPHACDCGFARGAIRCQKGPQARIPKQPAKAAGEEKSGPLGRMAFTNYLIQSIILSWIFYGFGLALFGRLSVLESLAVAVVIYAAQAAASAWWLSRFRFGPVEWLWRSLMYGKLQPVAAHQVSLK